MTVQDDTLRDKRPRYLRIFDSEYHHFRTMPKSGRADAMAVYMCLAHHANSKTDTAFPSHARIMEQTGLSKPTVIKAIAALTAAGLIVVQRRTIRGERVSNLYTLQTVVVNGADYVVSGIDEVAKEDDEVVKEIAYPVNALYPNQTQEQEEINKEGVPPFFARVRGGAPPHRAPPAEDEGAPGGGVRAPTPNKLFAQEWSRTHPQRRR